MKDYSEVGPPQDVTVEHDHRAVLYLPDGRALVRQAGFVPAERKVMPMTSKGPVYPPKGGKGGKKGGKRGC